jgi:hypothetical protein
MRRGPSFTPADDSAQSPLHRNNHRLQRTSSLLTTHSPLVVLPRHACKIDGRSVPYMINIYPCLAIVICCLSLLRSSGWSKLRALYDARSQSSYHQIPNIRCERTLSLLICICGQRPLNRYEERLVGCTNLTVIRNIAYRALNEAFSANLLSPRMRHFGLLESGYADKNMIAALDHFLLCLPFTCRA